MSRAPRLFATPADEPRARRASDLVLLVGSTLALVMVSFAAAPTPGFARAVARLLAALPSFLDGAWQVSADLLVLYAVLVAIGTLVCRRWSVARDVLLAVVVATVLWLVVGRVVEDVWPAVWDSLRAEAPPPRYPSPRLALCAAVVLTVAPHLTRPVRRLGRWLVGLGAFGLAALGATTPLGAVVALVVVAAVARLRRFVLGWVKRLASEAWGAVRGIRSPRRIALLLGGSLATELLFPVALAAFTLALGFPVGLGELLLINISVGLLAGLLPVPGGIGVVEGGLTIGLVQAGVPEQVAIVAVLMYRLATFYLPPIWGYFAFRWLERNDHL